jgi:predicted dithiol-disulfide oxidoreductase (DUF899 family)
MMKQTTTHKTATREEWLAARLDLLAAEKELTRRDELARRRQELPWVRVDKAYRFETMKEAPRCRTCSEGARSFSSTTSCSGPTTRSGARRVRRSRTPSTASSSIWRTTTSCFRPCRGRRSRSCRRTNNGWGGRFPGRPRSAATSTSTSTSRSPRSNSARWGVEYDYRRGGHALDATQVPEPVAQFAAMCETDAPTYTRDRPGMSAFVHEDGVVYHSYSTYARGLDGLWGMYQWLDRAPKGRNEPGVWWRRHDEYDKS